MQYNPTILLSAALQSMELHGATIIRINNNGNNFNLDDIDTLITDIDTNNGDKLSFSIVDNKDITKFIEYISGELKSHNHINLDELHSLTNDIINEWNNKQNKISYTALDSSTIDGANGYPSLNDLGQIDVSLLPSNYKLNRPFKVVDTIEQRDSLPNIDVSLLVLVNKVIVPHPIDPLLPSTEKTVLYYCKSVDPLEWIPYLTINEIDAVLEWDILNTKPNSTVTDIDEMVEDSHNHINQSIIDKFSIDDNNNLMYDNEIIIISKYGARRMSVFSQTVTSYSDTFVLDDRFNSNSDTLWRIIYNGIKLIESKDYTFEKITKTITFLNNFKPTTHKDLTITKYCKVA